MIKRMFDVWVSASLLFLLAPLLLLTAILVYRLLGFPVLFTQIRPGLHGKPFRMFKFRSMANQNDPSGRLLPDADRLTPFGRFLRSTSLDELPELWNVLIGDMSLVGPRPLLVEYVEFYSEEQARRHEVRPGITGWAQINGRNAMCWEDKFRLDVWYVDHYSFLLDLKILWITLRKVLMKEGVEAVGGGTMHKFKGSNQDGEVK